MLLLASIPECGRVERCYGYYIEEKGTEGTEKVVWSNLSGVSDEKKYICRVNVGYGDGELFFRRRGAKGTCF